MIPLAEQLRPNHLNDFYGQQHLLNDVHPLKQVINNKQLHSMILWGPSGTGKTTLARIICNQVDGYFVQISAVLDGVKELRIVIENAKKYQNIEKPSILFVDEIHRFNKAQQDAFLPHIENGLITLIGTTTENPAFEVNRSLLSRVSVYILEPLDKASLGKIFDKCVKTLKLNISEEIKLIIITHSMGDCRRLINVIEKLTHADLIKLNKQSINKFLQDNVANFDKGGDIFYQQLSAFHKSVRGSSPDAALYWMARMLVGGCGIKTIARRLLAIASEDIGNADPRALEITLNAWNVYERVGDKEGNRAVAQAAVYCAVAPKSNAVYKAFNQAMNEAKSNSHLPVPKHLYNTPTWDNLSKNSSATTYRYAHNEKDAISIGQTYFPESLGEQIYYKPTDRGLEIKISEKLKQLRGLS